MKRILSGALVALSACGLLMGCGRGSDTATGASSTGDSSTTKPVAQSEQKNDFESGTQPLSVSGLTCDVPLLWMKKESDDKQFIYFYPVDADGKAFVMVNFSENEGSILNERMRGGFIEGVMRNVEDGVCTQDEVKKTDSGISYASNKVEGVLSGVRGKIHNALFDVSRGTVAIGMFGSDEINLDFSNDFEHIINSVKIEIPTASSIENVAGAEMPVADQMKEYTFTAGNYLVGEDIVAGRYDAIWISGRGNCFGGGMIETFGESEQQIKEYKNVELKSGDKVEVKGTLKIKFVSK